MISWDPRPLPITDHNQEGEEQSWEGINAQELCLSGPGDLLWKQMSTLNCTLVINWAGHERDSENSGRLRLMLLVEDRHAHVVPLRTNIEAAV